MSLVKFTNVPYNIYNFPMDVTRQKLQDYLFIYKKKFSQCRAHSFIYGLEAVGCGWGVFPWFRPQRYRVGWKAQERKIFYD